jgi:serine/threonine-protein kinase
MFSDVRPGELLAGKYLVERVLGRGGMGLVLAARHVQLEEPVAIKLMLPDVAASPDAVARFMREARASAKIRSEHVVRVSDVGTLEGGQPYMVMEYLEGVDLGALLATRGRLPLEDVAEYLLQACEAIAEAHALGIVHRDLKPSNLFLTQRVDGSPLVKVLDFGISKVSATHGGRSELASITQTSALMGSPLYMSPEQMTSARSVDARSDVWSLGVILYELLSGHPPFSGETLPEVCALILEGRAVPLRERVPELPPGIDALIQRCLLRDLGGRVADVGELSRALVAFAPSRARVSLERISAALGTNSQARPVRVESAPMSVPPNRRTNTAWAESNASSGKRTSRLVLAGAVTLVLTAGTLTMLLGRGKPEPSTASAVAPAQPARATPDTPPVTAPEPALTALTVAPVVPEPAALPASTSIDARPAATSRGAARKAPGRTATKPTTPAIAAPAVAPPAPEPGTKTVAGTPSASKPKAPLSMGGRL